EFQRDIVIDMYCYRLRGHNEGDEPSFTQPLLYQAIESRKSVRESYLEHLLDLEGISREEAEAIVESRQSHLEAELESSRHDTVVPQQDAFAMAWQGYVGGPDSETPDVDTGVEREVLVQVLRDLAHVPKGFAVHPKIARGTERRFEMAEGNLPLDWAAAEALAMGTLALQGAPVRMTGQDCER